MNKCSALSSQRSAESGARSESALHGFHTQGARGIYWDEGRSEYPALSSTNLEVFYGRQLP